MRALTIATALACLGVVAAPVAAARDTRLCPFPLSVTATADAITLRNDTTGKTAVVRRSPRRIRLSPENNVPYLSTNAAGGDPRVIDPCALVAPAAPPTQPRATRAPWAAPAYPLSQIAHAGLVPVTGALVRHDHVHLNVIVDGRSVVIPAGIGQVEPVDRGPGPCPPPPESRSIGDCAPGRYVTPAVAISPLHPHTTSGIIHIESDRPARFTLGQFFDEWRVRFDGRCVGAYCTGGGKELRVFVDGKPMSGDPRQLELRDRQEIAVVFGGAGAFAHVPARYAKRWPIGCGGPGEQACLRR